MTDDYIRRAARWLTLAQEAGARNRRTVPAALTAIEAALADGYPTNTGYDRLRGSTDPQEGGTTQATLLANGWLIDHRDDILAQCKAMAHGQAHLADLCAQALDRRTQQTADHTQLYNRLRCSTTSIDPWVDPTCTEIACDRADGDGLCIRCYRRRQRFLANPDNYQPRLKRRTG